MSESYNRDEATNGEADGEKLPVYNIIRSVQIGRNAFKLFTSDFVFILAVCDETTNDEGLDQIYCVDVYTYENSVVELIRSYDDRKNPHARKVFWHAMVLSQLIGP